MTKRSCRKPNDEQSGERRPVSLRDAIAAAVERITVAEGISQAEVARRAGLSPQRLSDYLNRRRDLTGETLDPLLASVGLAVAPHPSARSRVITRRPQFRQ